MREQFAFNAMDDVLILDYVLNSFSVAYNYTAKFCLGLTLFCYVSWEIDDSVSNISTVYTNIAMKSYYVLKASWIERFLNKIWYW